MDHQIYGCECASTDEIPTNPAWIYSSREEGRAAEAVRYARRHGLGSYAEALDAIEVEGVEGWGLMGYEVPQEMRMTAERRAEILRLADAWALRFPEAR